MKLKPGERIDDLQRGGLRIIQSESAFRFGTDAVLLSSFANLHKNDRVCDLGTGCGILPILLHARCPSAVFSGLEIQPEVADMAARSVALNKLERHISIHCADIKDAPDVFGSGSFDAVVCTPPYGRRGAALAGENEALRVARHETLVTLPECVSAAGRLIKGGGRASFIHQPDRMLELMTLMRQHGMEPKRVRLVYPRTDKPPNLVLVEAIRQCRPGLKWLPPLILYADGRATEELERIYHRNTEGGSIEK